MKNIWREKMKKTFSIIAGCAILISISTAAYSAEGPYVSGNIGISIVNDLTATGVDDQGPWSANTSLDKGYAIHAALGYDFNPIRAEVELGYAKNDFDKVDTNEKATDGDVTATTLFANAYYDFHNSSSFTPYLGAGLGYAKISYNDLNGQDWDNPFDEDDSVFAYQFMAGIAFVITDNISADLSYRYMSTSDPTMEDSYGTKTDFEYDTHNILLGMKYTF